MALTPRYAIQEAADSTGFYLTDITGSYDAATNPGGYGAPNIAFLTSNIAEITLHDNAGNVIGIADTEFSFSLFSADRVMFIASSFYSQATFADQVIQITYTVKDSGGTVQGVYDSKVPFYSFTEINLKNAFIKLGSADCGCDDGVGTKLDFYRSRLTAFKYMPQNGVYDTADAGIKQLVQDTNDFCFQC